MTPNVPAEPANFPEVSGGFRCRRYLFDREVERDLPKPEGEAPRPDRTPPASSRWWDRGLEGR